MIKLDHSKLLGFKLAAHTADGRAGSKAGSKFGAKLGAKVGSKPTI